MDDEDVLGASIFSTGRFQLGSGGGGGEQAEAEDQLLATEAETIGASLRSLPTMDPFADTVDPVAASYDAAWRAAAPFADNTVSVSSARRILSLASIDDDDKINAILALSVLARTDPTAPVDRHTFNRMLALAGLAQAYEPISINVLREYETQKSHVPVVLAGISSHADQLPGNNQALSFHNSTTNNDDFFGESTAASSIIDPRSHRPSLVTVPSPPAYSDTDCGPWLLDQDHIRLTTSEEKGGSVFKHVLYVLESRLLKSKVQRRYSDFVWLLESVLIKRYPFRILPWLPPKRFGGGDRIFLEKRRRGLYRFINIIANHPVLKDDEVVLAFFRYEHEMAEYKRLNAISVDEEYTKVHCIAESLRASVPADFDTTIDHFAASLPETIKNYDVMVSMAERMAQRSVGHALDLQKFTGALSMLTSVKTCDCFRLNCTSCEMLDTTFLTVDRHLNRLTHVLQHHARNQFDGVVDALRRQREYYLSFRELLDRHKRLLMNDLVPLQKRIVDYQTRLNNNHLQPPTPSLLRDSEKLENLIRQEQEVYEKQTKRNEYARITLWQEFRWLHVLKAMWEPILRSYVQMMMKYNTEAGECFHELLQCVNSMTTNGF